MQDLTAEDLEKMWTQGRGGEPGLNQIGVQFKPYPECLPGYFGGFGTIVHDSSHEVQVRLGKGQHHLKMPRSYLRLYPSKQVREEWLELTNQVETWTAIGTRPLVLFKHCHNAFCLFFHCHNALRSSFSLSSLCSGLNPQLLWHAPGFYFGRIQQKR